MVDLNGGENDEHEDLLARVGVEEDCCRSDTYISDCTARGKENSYLRRQSEIGAGAVGTVTPTTSFEWWYQSSFNYWVLLRWMPGGSYKSIAPYSLHKSIA